MRPRLTIAAIVGFLLTLEAAGQSATGIFGETRLPTPASQPTEIVVGWDGALWFTEFAANKVARYYPPTRELIEYVVPTPNSGPLGITSGGTGAIWFTEFTAGKIAMINSAGVITEYTIPTPASAPVGISGATGSIWFTESAANKIGHLTPAGFTETIIPTPASLPMGLIVDGVSVWFAEVQGNKIGRLSVTSGTIIETVIPTPNAGLTNLSSDNEGRVWFAESAANKIGFLSPTGFLSPGAITEFPVPSPQSTPTHVAADFNAGGLWFTEQASNKIGFVTATGRFTEYVAPTPASQPTGVTVYFSGNVFFTELSANAIGSLHQDAIVFIATRGVAGWTTEFDIANSEGRAATVFGSQSFTPFFVCAGPCPPFIGLLLPAQGTGSATGSQAMYGGDFAAVFFHTLEDGVLPSVRARFINPSSPARSIDLPGIRLSTLSSLGRTPLVFPSALRTASGGHSNLLIAEVGSGSGLRVGLVTALQLQVEAFSADGQSLGRSAFSVAPGASLYMVDLLGMLGVGNASQAQVRVTQTGGDGIMWAYLITVADDGDIGISTGATP